MPRSSERPTVLVIAVAAALALALVPGALADRAFADPAGDSGTAPDITAVSVAHDPAGTVTVSVTTNQTVLAPEATFFGYIDTDGNSATGFPYRGLGAEHFFLADADGGVIFHVAGNSITIDFSSTFTASYASGKLTARFDRSEIGTTDRFALLIEVEQDDANGNTIAADFAPDGPPFYEYSFVEEPLSLSLGRPVGAPAKPVAGKPFAVGTPVTRSDGQPFTTGEVACSARIGRTALRSAGRVAGGSAYCSMRIPKGAKGKTLRGSLTVRVATAKAVTKAFAFSIR